MCHTGVQYDFHRLEVSLLKNKYMYIRQLCRIRSFQIVFTNCRHLCDKFKPLKHSRSLLRHIFCKAFEQLHCFRSSWKVKKIRENKSSNCSGPQSSVMLSFRDPPGFPADNKSGQAQNHQRESQKSHLFDKIRNMLMFV